MILKLFSQIVSKISSILFPPQCFICRKNTRSESACRDCLKHLQKPVETPWPFITSIYSFKNPNLKKIIHAIKYFHRKDLVAPFAVILASEIAKVPNCTSFILLPIPMPAFRKYIRGYNHTEELASQIGKILNLQVHSKILTQSNQRGARRQVMTRSRSERLRNKQNAFRVQGDVRGKNIFLIDDVTTTGATLSEARKALIQAGAAAVCAFTIAH